MSEYVERVADLFPKGVLEKLKECSLHEAVDQWKQEQINILVGDGAGVLAVEKLAQEIVNQFTDLNRLEQCMQIIPRGRKLMQDFKEFSVQHIQQHDYSVDMERAYVVSLLEKCE